MDTATGNQCELAAVEAAAAGDEGMNLSMTSVINMNTYRFAYLPSSVSL